jgi:glutamate N-acetyltransferase/amino-acid N-acetyltransferase
MTFKEISGGVAAPKGFVAGGAIAGIKASGNSDLSLIFTKSPAISAGEFTTNRVRAASVTENENALPGSNFHAIICNSGNANACTGVRGIKDVIKTREATAKALSIDESSVLVASTGIIGEFLPVDKIEAKLPELANSLSKEGAHAFATAIMTTDTVEKEYAIEVEFSHGTAIIGGTTKGAGMIHPNMATMLGFITTDVNIPQYTLNAIHKETVDKTFNNLTVDGDTSTNDMVLVLANGDSGVTVEHESDIEIFEKALFDVYNMLCAKIAEDGEGATKRIEINVVGGKDFNDCKLAAKAVANSNLVKTAMFGNDPNWGRILCAVGYSGAYFHPEQITVSLCKTSVYNSGGPAEFVAKELSEKMAEKVVYVDVDLGEGGNYHAVAHTCDFSYDYVKINAEYHT